MSDIQALAEAILALPERRFGVSKSGNLTHHGKLISMSPVEFLGGDIELLSAEYPVLIGQCITNRAAWQRVLGEAAALLAPVLKAQAEAEAEAREVDVSNVKISLLPRCLGEYRLILNVGTGKNEIVAYHIKSRTETPLNLSAFERSLSARLGKDDKEAYFHHSGNILPAIMTYDPEGMAFYEEGGFFRWNRYHKPAWARKFDPDEKRETPTEFVLFMKHLFPDDAARKHAYEWLAAATYYRAKTILILCGRPGIGKNIFIESIGRMLVGDGNYRSSTRRFEAKFHSGIAASRIYFMDEMALTENVKEDLKQYYNGFAAIERKGVDVNEPEKIHASIVIANNFVSRIHLSEEDRKFSAPDLTTVSLKEAWGKKRIGAFLKRLEDKEYQRDIASLLWRKVGAIKDYDDVCHGELFRQICVTSRPEWFQNFIRLCYLQKLIPEKTVRKLNDGKHVGLTRLQDRINEYEQTNGIRLCKLEAKEGGLYLVVSQVCANENGEADEDDF